MKLFISVFALYILISSNGWSMGDAPKSSNALLYLSIVSTEKQNLGIVSKYRLLAKKFNNLKIISSSDCANLKPDLVLFTSDMSGEKSTILAAVEKAKKYVADSYIRECEVKPISLLALGLSFIHRSILNLPKDTINWSFDDARSILSPLDNGYAVLVEKIFNGHLDDEVEGRQALLYLVNEDGSNKHKILAQCWDLDHLAQNGSIITFQCMTGVAATQEIHSSYIYDLMQNKLIFETEYCRQPDLKNESRFSCYEEAINEFGELKLTPREYILE